MPSIPTYLAILPLSPRLVQPSYRADIDGLRAMAILSVVAFHASPLWLKGGFIGVDIFFVVSGFLITTIIVGNLEKQKFSFVEFYRRRIVRIFPALFVVLAASFAFGWLMLLPQEYTNLGEQIAGGAGFVSNFIFWQSSGYFDTAATTKPLLHLWSLAIEEQFYLFWPLFVWATWRSPLNISLAASIVCLISFLLNLHATQHYPVAAFYFPLTRFWELAVGSTLASLAVQQPSIIQSLNKALANLLSFIGTALILTGLVVINSERAFPGWWAMLPVFGTAAIIAAGPDAWINREILSRPLAVRLGLISYALYLWHWPLLSFAHIIAIGEPSRALRFAAVGTAILLAWATYEFVEHPLRFGQSKWAYPLASTLMALMLISGFAGYAVYAEDGLPSRSSATSNLVYDGEIGSEGYFAYLNTKFYSCTPAIARQEAATFSLKFGPVKRCYQSKETGPIDLAIIGDSHAESLFLGLAEALPSKNVVYYIGSNEAPILDPDKSRTFQSLTADSNIRTVIISVYWKRYQESHPGLKAELAQLVDRLTSANKAIYIVDDRPDFSFAAIDCKYQRAAMFGKPRVCDQDRGIFDQQYQAYITILDSVTQGRLDTHMIKTARNFCSSNKCSMVLHNKLMFSDNNHLNINGSKFVAEKIVADFPELSNKY